MDANGKYLSVLPNAGNRLSFSSKYADEWELFQAVDASDYKDKFSRLQTVVGIKSAANGKFISAIDSENLITHKNEIDEFERFIVYYGPDNKIALKFKEEDKFITATNENEEVESNITSEASLSTLKLTKGYLDNYKVFEIVKVDEELLGDREALFHKK